MHPGNLPKRVHESSRVPDIVAMGSRFAFLRVIGSRFAFLNNYCVLDISEL